MLECDIVGDGVSIGYVEVVGSETTGVVVVWESGTTQEPYLAFPSPI